MNFSSFDASCESYGSYESYGFYESCGSYGTQEPCEHGALEPIVVTGMGAVSPVGLNLEDTFYHLYEGKSGLLSLESEEFHNLGGEEEYDIENIASFPSRVAGLVPLHPKKCAEQLGISSKELNKMGRFILWGLMAAKEALLQAQWMPESLEDRKKTGVLVGSGIGGLPNIQQASYGLKEKGWKGISPFFVPSSLINLLSGHISMAHGFRGPNISTVTACASGSHAIGESLHWLRSGRVKVMVCGGAEGAVCGLGLAGFSRMKALSENFNDCPQKASRPWDRQRDGFVIGEGAGILVLETLSHAQERGAKIYGEVVGYGASGDAYHIAAPREDGEGAEDAMKMALESAHLSPEVIGYVNAHGTSTPLGDAIELKALERVFQGGSAYPYVSSTKSATGHLLGGAGALEAVLCLKSLLHQKILPTLNLEEPEETFLPLVGPKGLCLKEEKKVLEYALSNSFGFGGTNSCLIFKKHPHQK